MRLTKSLALTACLALSAIATAPFLRSGEAFAQGPRPFRDAWFWGIHGGVASYTAATPIEGSATGNFVIGNASMAPQVGVDWLITRKTGGLYVSYAQAFMTTQGVIENGPSAADSGFRFVDVKNLRRVNAAAMIFPGSFVRLHPYVGFGVSFDYLGGVQPQFSTTDGDRQEEFAEALLSEVKAALGPLFIAGAQYRALNSVSAFGQFTASAMSRDFLLSNGNPISLGFQLGVRYNIGSSIDREF